MVPESQLGIAGRNLLWPFGAPRGDLTRGGTGRAEKCRYAGARCAPGDRPGEISADDEPAMVAVNGARRLA
jgi:hypothetical protein